MTRPALPPVRELLSHAPPMVLLDTLESFDDRGCVCLTRLHVDSPFVRDGRAHAVVALELFGQAAAAWIGVTRRARGAPIGPGFVVGVRELVLGSSTVAVGERLRVEVECTLDHESGIARFRGALDRLSGDGERSRVARALFTVYASTGPHPARGDA